MTMLEKFRHVFREGGAGAVVDRGLGFAYRRIRPHLPRGAPACLGGIPTCYDAKAADRLVPRSWLPWWMSDPTGCPSYEGALVSGLKEHVRTGDAVVVVGGGIGVTAVTAALRTGPTGRVACFEGSADNCGLVRETAALNGVTNLTVHHAVVGSSIAVYGDASETGAVVAADRLPPCDVLELDCEGAEIQILREMTIRPRVLLVETHGLYQSPASLVRSLMEQCGYAVSDRGWAEPRMPEECARNDIRVLLGTLGRDAGPVSPPSSDSPSRR